MSSPERLEVDPNNVAIPQRELCNRLGFPGAKEIPPQFKEKVETSLSRTRATAKPVSLVLNLEAIQSEKELRFGELSVHGTLARKHLGLCSEISVILLTLGREFDELIYSDPSDTLGIYFLDGIGSEMAEYSLREVDRILRERRPAWVGGSRISPGYGDMPLSLNKEIVRIVKGDDIGVFIVEGSFEMSPRKTISALIGWRKRDEIER